MTAGPFDAVAAGAIMRSAGPLTAGPPMVWREKQQQVNFRHCATTLHDAHGIAIPGLTVQFETRRPARVGDCYFMFGVYFSSQGGRWRVLQVEVYPRDKPSHREPDGTVYLGPHMHRGVQAFPIDDSRLDCQNWAGSLSVFLALANISNLKVSPPT